jgi:serpin B
VLVLVNALYLKAAWDEPFSKGQPATFHTGDSDILAPTMITNEPVRGVVGKDWSAATIPYLGRGVAMTVLVPALGRFAAVLGALDAGLFDRARADRDLLQVTMPLFSVTATPDALKVAQRLGIRDIFEYGLADLSGIAGRPGDLYAAAFVHQAVVTVDEKGTEAAAATGMTIATMSLKPTTEELIVNRPFIFWISETRTGAPLFLGAVTDPTASA